MLQTFYLYAGIFLGLFAIYNCMRTSCPRLYNPRDACPEAGMQCDLAARRHPGLRWVPAMLRIPSNELLDQVCVRVCIL